MSERISELIIPNEPIFLKYNGIIYNGKIVTVEKNGKPQIGIIDLHENSTDDKIYSPSGFCSKHMGYECNGWVKLYVIRDGINIKLEKLRGNKPQKTSKRYTVKPGAKTQKSRTPSLDKSPPPPSKSPSLDKSPPPPPSKSPSLDKSPPPPSKSPSLDKSPPPSKSPSLDKSRAPQNASVYARPPKSCSPDTSKVASPHNNSTYDSGVSGAAIILWYYDEKRSMPMLLVGNESKYVSDDYPVEKSVETVFEPDFEKAKIKFLKRTEELEKLFNINKIQYDTPKYDGEAYHVNYRYLSERSKRGIIKGQREDTDTSPMNTIIREICEELGVHIKPKTQKKIKDNGICDKYRFFSMQIDKTDIDTEFKKRINERIAKKYGEMFELKFEPLCSVLSDINSFNSKSKCAIVAFKKQYFSRDPCV